MNLRPYQERTLTMLYDWMIVAAFGVALGAAVFFYM